jgi:hypothetical protein
MTLIVAALALLLALLLGVELQALATALPPNAIPSHAWRRSCRAGAARDCLGSRWRDDVRRKIAAGF